MITAERSIFWMSFAQGAGFNGAILFIRQETIAKSKLCHPEQPDSSRRVTVGINFRQLANLRFSRSGSYLADFI
jgi:hypothetical protein